ncbi:hypothetical protein JHK87_043145 [Glycine soja]|nr:hypothetical protein JHK87_043145 [Glycine soja]
MATNLELHEAPRKVMAKSVEKPFSIIGLLAVSGGDKKKTLPTNKPKPFNKGRSSTVETHYKSTHDLLPPHKRKMVVNIEDNVEPAGSSLVNFSNFGGPLIWMSLSQEIDHVILSKDWESIQKKGLADLESTMSILAGETNDLGTLDDVMVDGFIKTQRFIEASNVDAGLEGPQMPPFPSISHSSHIDAYVCCFQNARVVNATLEVVCLILFKMARVTKSSNTNKSLRLVLVSGNHHKSSPSRSLPHFLGFFCTHSTWTAEGTKAS